MIPPSDQSGLIVTNLVLLPELPCSSSVSVFGTSPDQQYPTAHDRVSGMIIK